MEARNFVNMRFIYVHASSRKKFRNTNMNMAICRIIRADEQVNTQVYLEDYFLDGDFESWLTTKSFYLFDHKIYDSCFDEAVDFFCLLPFQLDD